MTKAYSYARWSSTGQTSGDSLRRQLELSRDYAAKHRLDLDETFRDAGVSAYRGKNRDEGALKNFLAHVESGKIEAGSFLLVESLDRLSRQEVLFALELFISIVRRGITIVTLINEQGFDQDTLNTNPSILFVSIGEMIRAHSESEHKGQRVARANENKRRLARLANTPMTALCPGWLKLAGDGRGYDHKLWELIPEKVAIVRRIFDEALGLGKRGIAARLNRDGISAFRGNRGWHASSIQKILSNEAVIGIFQPCRKIGGIRTPDGPPISGYFPAIIDEAVFWQAQQAVKNRRHRSAGRKGPAYSNLFSGIGTCGSCGARLVFINKGPLPKGGQYLTCGMALRGLCGNRVHFPYEVLEQTIVFLDVLLVLAPEEKERSHDAVTSRVAELEALLARRQDGEAIGKSLQG